MTGKIRWRINSPAPWFGGTHPLAGSQPRWTAKMATRMMPRRKLGTAMPSCVPADTTSAPRLRLRNASHMPTGIAPASASSIARPMRMSVTWARSSTSGVISCCEDKDCPKLPVNRPFTHSQYCVSSGRSSPSSELSLPTASSVAFTPSATRAGLPGTARMSAKMMLEATKSVNAKRSNGRTMARPVVRRELIGPPFRCFLRRWF